MGRVLVTGSSGKVGKAVVGRLERDGWDVRRFDLRTGADLRRERAVSKAVQGCDAVVHSGAIAHDNLGTPSDIVATNVLGTWHVLLAAEQHALERVVVFSSAQVFGFAEGEGMPLHLPVDDDHPLRAARPYGMSKRLAEEMCSAWTDRTRIPSIVLRPVLVLDDAELDRFDPAEAELGAFVHLDDVVEATALALSAEVTGHVRLTLCGPGHFDTSATEDTLGWKPTRGWPV